MQAAVTEDTSIGVAGIGELAERTGVSVRTIRFYCDSGVLDYRRTGAGHRIFDLPAAIDQLLLVRRLRALDVPLPTIVRVLGGAESLGTAVAVERAAVEAELDALRWRRAALLAIEHASPGERAERVALLAAVHDRDTVRDTLVALWRPILGTLPGGLFDSFIEMHAPLPGEPEPGHVIAYAELSALATDAHVKTAMAHQIWRSNRADVGDRRQLVTAVAQACEAAAPLVAAAEKPQAGTVLDQYVAAHAAARGRRDTPRFRRELLVGATDPDPRLQRYWRLTAQVTGVTATIGAIHHWMFDALHCSVRTE